MVSPWPCAIWGIDLIGRLPTAKSGIRYAIVSVDYFTKWAESKPLTTIISKKMINFVTKNIICRYGVPQKIITDNGTQFESKSSKISANDSRSEKASQQWLIRRQMGKWKQ